MTRRTSVLEPGSFFRTVLRLSGVALLMPLTVAVCRSPSDPREVEPAARHPLLDGYTGRLSYQVGDTVDVYLSADDVYDQTSVDLYDLKPARVGSVRVALARQEVTGGSPWADGLGYSRSARYVVRPIPSGMYSWEHKVPFIVRAAPLVTRVKVLYASNTLAAYSADGGKSLYDFNSLGHLAADSVSFMRRLGLEDRSVECLEAFADAASYGFGYLTDMDMDDSGNLEGVDLLVIIGHSEYWTRGARQNFDRFVDDGGNALILSGNTMWWQVRYSADGTRLVCYKSADQDPIGDPLLATTRWNDDQLQYPIIPSIGADFDHGGYGLRPDDGWDGFKLIDTSPSYLAGTGLRVGDIIHVPTTEFDGTLIAGFDASGFPYPDVSALSFDQIRIIGFDRGSRGGATTIGTWIEFRKSPTSGIVINVGSTDWCSAAGMGGDDGALIRAITFNMIDYLLVAR